MATEMTGLDPALIQSLMANSRQRNAYGPKVLEFANSDEAAINPRDVWPLEFAEKKVESLYQGFNTAVKKADLTEVIKVKRNDDDIFLLHLDRCRIVTEAAANGK